MFLGLSTHRGGQLVLEVRVVTFSQNSNFKSKFMFDYMSTRYAS